MQAITIILSFIFSMSALSQNELFISGADQTKLHIREFGSGSPIIILAGGPGQNADYLNPIWDTLSKTFRCIVPDQRGTGKSLLAAIDSASLSMENYVNDLESLRNYFNLQKLTLVGHSWGGMLAMEYASKYPGRVENLVLIGPGGPTAKFAGYFNDNMLLRLHKEDLEEASKGPSQLEYPLDAMWPGYFFDRQRALKSKKTTDFGSLFGQKGVRSIAASNYFSIEDERVSLLKNYKGEVSIIQGRQDPIG